MKTLIKENGDWDKRKILECDCEGCEWDLLETIDDETLV